MGAKGHGCNAIKIVWKPKCTSLLNIKMYLNNVKNTVYHLKFPEGFESCMWIGLKTDDMPKNCWNQKKTILKY